MKSLPKEAYIIVISDQTVRWKVMSLLLEETYTARWAKLGIKSSSSYPQFNDGPSCYVSSSS